MYSGWSNVIMQVFMPSLKTMSEAYFIVVNKGTVITGGSVNKRQKVYCRYCIIKLTISYHGHKPIPT